MVRLFMTKFRSGFEQELADQLDRLGVRWEYEAYELPWMRKITNGICLDCKGTNVAQMAKYTVDFYLPEYDFFIEGKGKWVSRDRTKHRTIRRASPETDVRIVFQRDNWLTKTKTQKYSEYCNKYGIVYAIEVIPPSWFKRKRRK